MALPDPALPAFDDLLDASRALPVLAAALEGIGDVQEVRPTQVRHDRGRRVVIRYAAHGRWPEGWTAVQTLVAQHGTAAPPAGTAVVGDGRRRVAVWRYPFDPHLPGLPPAAHLSPVRDLVHELTQAVGAPTPTRVIPRAYRPTRRAVLQVVAEGAGRRTDVCYLKVVRPHRLARIVRAHTTASAHVPVPPVLATSAEQGVLVVGALPGDTLRERLLGSGQLPAPSHLLALQHALLDTPADGVPAARSAAVTRHADVLAGLLPGRTAVIRRVAAVAQAAADAGRIAGEPVGIVHGDLYEAQVLVAGDTGMSLLDLDGMGTGALLDDCAALLAHLHVLAGWRPARAVTIRSWAEAYERACGALVDPSRLRHRAAGLVLGLAAGGFTTREPAWRATAESRLRLATALADIDEGTLMSTSRPLHRAASR